ncbi:DUF4232 domain-containing protein [Streptomyces sp. VRA16 Mangrove soil]|uniref:DUF4232 domain-containing protein n=1 Tax=Streptomyces sp. VRA16 Mangrove soil TaxID=2817434 RepID=UPI001A9E02E2|nr:DUF4232 domain-containing protein [Streptomyces sp. VRA16 Mangrove soil]MBO1338038.1 DUF4232 domain-containing protein [Streptomyces sp. VRA16 Mangrove soil]
MNAKLTRMSRAAAAVAATAVLALTATACGGSDDKADTSSSSGPASGSASNSATESTGSQGSASSQASADSGKSGGTAVTSPSPRGAGQAVAAKSACTNAELKPSIVHGTDADPDGKADQTQAQLLFTNVGKRTCTVQGHPGVDLVNAKGETWNVAWQKQTAEKVTLKPGVATMAQLTFLPISPSSTAPDQQPFLPVTVKVTPPDTTATASLAWPWQDIAVLRQDSATHPGTFISTVNGTASS